MGKILGGLLTCVLSVLCPPVVIMYMVVKEKIFEHLT